jgi:hypothetical protein
MIPEENINRDGFLSFNRVRANMGCVFDYIQSKLPLLNNIQSIDLHSSLMKLEVENIIIPIDLVKNIRHFEKDELGCRVYNWRLLTSEQIKNAMRLNGRYDRVRVAYSPLSSFLAHTQVGESSSIPDMPTYEEYDKFLNITYLVNDEFMMNWLNPAYDEPNVAKKKVEDCSVSELLFAVKKKLSKQSSTSFHGGKK